MFKELFTEAMPPKMSDTQRSALYSIKDALGSEGMSMSNDAGVNMVKFDSKIKIGLMFDKEYNLIGLIDRTGYPAKYCTLKDTLKSIKDLKSDKEALEFCDQKTGKFKQVRDYVAKSGGHSIKLA